MTPTEALRGRLADAIYRSGADGTIGAEEYVRSQRWGRARDPRLIARARRELNSYVDLGLLERTSPRNGTSKRRGSIIVYRLTAPLSGVPSTVDPIVNVTEGTPP